MNKLVRLSGMLLLSNALFWTAHSYADEATCVSPKAVAAYKNNSPKPVVGTGDVTWKVIYSRASSAPTAAINVTGFQKKVGSGEWGLADKEQWQLELGPRGQTPNAPLRGDLKTLQFWVLANPLKANSDIRFVAPDGACAVQVAYPAGATVAPFSVISVVGDSLIQDNTINYMKFFAALKNPNWHVHVDARNGAKWANYDQSKTLPVLDQANTTMIDELRGAAKNIFHNAAIVVALGANDIGYVSNSQPLSTEAQTKMHNVLRELMTIPTATCVVLVSPPSSTANALFNDNAEALERLYSFTALGAVDGVYANRIRVVDFGTQSKGHALGSKEPWFLFDSLHLNEAGAMAYAAAIINGVSACNQ